MAVSSQQGIRKKVKKVKWKENNKQLFEGAMQELFPTADCNTIKKFIDCIKLAAESAEMWTFILEGKQIPDQPWHDKECRERKKELTKALYRAKKADWKEKQRNEFKERQRDYVRIRKLKEKEFYQTHVRNLQNARDAKAFYNSVKQFRRLPRTPNLVPADVWVKFYEAEMGKKEIDKTEFFDARHEDLDREITLQELQRKIKSLKNNKAPGPDDISNEFLKSLSDEAHEAFLNILNVIMTTTKIPIEWHKLETVMLYKKGAKDDPRNYRPISLANTTMKVFTGIITDRLSDWAEKHRILPESQGGFRKGRGCQDRVFSLNAAIQAGILQGNKKIYALFVDYSRAFPSIPHHLLWKKLFSLGVSGNLVRILQNLYDGSFMQIRLPEGHSQPIELTEGLLQGCPLSPLLF